MVAAPRTFRPALPAVLATLAALVSCTLAHAQIIDSTSILAVERRVQEIDAAKDYGIRILKNAEFPNLRRAFRVTGRPRVNADAPRALRVTLS